MIYYSFYSASRKASGGGGKLPEITDAQYLKE